jgi:uncharacterized protein
VKIDVSKLEHGPLQFDERLTVEPERLASEEVSSPVVVHLVGEVRSHGASVSVLGSCRGEGSIACSRCLEPVAWNFDEQFCVEYRRADSVVADPEIGLEEADLEVSFLEGDQLDLLELAAEQVLLAMPMRILCNESCAGLCPTCGANRNRADACSCEPEIDPRWQALAGLSKLGPDS